MENNIVQGQGLPVFGQMLTNVYVKPEIYQGGVPLNLVLIPALVGQLIYPANINVIAQGQVPSSEILVTPQTQSATPIASSSTAGLISNS